MLPQPPHNIILFELDFDVKFPLLRLFLFLSDLKSTILRNCKSMKLDLTEKPHFKGYKKAIYYIKYSPFYSSKVYLR